MIRIVGTHLLIPLLLDVESANTVVLLLVSEQDMFKTFPHLITTIFMPNGDVHILDVIDPDQPRAQIVETETCLNEVCTLIHVLNPQGNPQPPKTPL